ncbi:TPA: SIR2 family protein, partial [Photobacterium damselae]
MSLFDIFEKNKKQKNYIIKNKDHFLQKILLGNSGDLVFFTGAGFSKSWNNDYPLGFDLFSIDDSSKNNIFNVAKSIHIHKPSKVDLDIEKENIKNNIISSINEITPLVNKKHVENLSSIINDIDKHKKLKTYINSESLKRSEYKYKKDCYEYFKEIKFSLDVFKRYPSLMPNHLDKTIIKKLELDIKNFVKDKFKTKVGEDELSLTSKKNLNMEFINFFKEIYEENSNISFISTNYDFIIEKIFYNIDKNQFINRGAIDHNKFTKEEWKKSSLSLYKINGGFDVFYKDDNNYFINYTDETSSPNIIIPSQDQDYSDKYFKNVFIKSANKLREANILIFIGYSLPEEDNIIRFLLKNFVDSNNSNKEVIIISQNLDSAEKIKEKVERLYPDLSNKDAIHIFDGSFNDLIK